MIECKVPRATLLLRAGRLMRFFSKSLSDARGWKGKWTMCCAIVGWLRTRLHCAGRSREVRLSLGDIQVEVDISRSEIFSYWELWYENGYELLPQFRATENACVVDVGANVGFYSIRQALRAKSGRVIAFEPSPGAFHRLQRNLEINRLLNVQAINSAIGASTGTVHFKDELISFNSHIVEESSAGTTLVLCSTLDSALPAIGVKQVDILKIDTEGNERAVLLGAGAILPMVKRIVLELHNDANEEMRLIHDMLRRAEFLAVARYGNVAYFERSNS